MAKLVAEETQRPRRFPLLRYFFGIGYLWHIAEVTNGSTYVIISALWFGITFGIIDILAAKKEGEDHDNN